jgi:hydroxymethylbilane synthase
MERRESDMTPILLATRGSALALAQADLVLAACRKAFPKLAFDLNVIKTTGDGLQTVAPAEAAALATRALFTKELETALLNQQADLAVHSLKDLPVDLPAGLKLAAVAGEREDVRDVLIYRLDNGFEPKMKLAQLPANLTVATGSARRRSQLLDLRPDFKTVEIRGNVPTRLQKLAAQPLIHGTILAAAGLARLRFTLSPAGFLEGDGVPKGLCAIFLEPEQMMPCVGQGAIGLEIRADDARTAEICRHLDHFETFQCVTAERSFLRGMGGGCQTPIGALAAVVGGRIRLRAVSFLDMEVERAEGERTLSEADELGTEVASKLKFASGEVEVEEVLDKLTEDEKKQLLDWLRKGSQ